MARGSVTATQPIPRIPAGLRTRTPATVQRGLEAFIRRTRLDELMVSAAIHGQTARLRSCELVARIRDRL